jgi:ComF family protein
MSGYDVGERVIAVFQYLFPGAVCVEGKTVKTTGWYSQAKKALPTAGRALVDLIYPPRCVWCQVDLAADQIATTHGLFCEDCVRRLAPPVGNWCVRCGAPADGLVSTTEGCGHCSGESISWDRTVALGRYSGDLSQAVLRTKRSANEELTLSLGRLLFETRRGALQELQAEVVVPVPLHWWRRIRRGTNGPDLIAEALAKCLGVPFQTSALQRSRLTALQVEVNRSERHLHQRKSFRVGNRRVIAGRRVLLVDDVLTTGATAAEAASVLLDGGASAVSVAVLARGVGSDAL